MTIAIDPQIRKPQSTLESNMDSTNDPNKNPIKQLRPGPKESLSSSSEQYQHPNHLISTSNRDICDLKVCSSSSVSTLSYSSLPISSLSSSSSLSSPFNSTTKSSTSRMLPSSAVIITMILLLFSNIFATCQAFDDYSSTSNRDALTKTINPGDKVDIPCSVVTPGGSVQWILNNKPILLDFSQNQRRHWNISNDGQASLTINRATRADEGLWECWELDSTGNVRQKAPIMRIVISNIPEEPYLEYDGRRLSSQSSITVREHTVITLNCVIKGQSSSIRSVQWFIDRENQTSHSRVMMEYSAEEDVSLTISVLTLNVSADFHAQMVYCQITHASWASSATISASFNVLYAPLFSITREPGFGYPVIEGMPLSLKCEIDANPPSEAKWERDPDPAQSNGSTAPMAPIYTNQDGSLNFSAIAKQDIGWYRCTTQHEFGFFASFGYFLNVRSRDELPQLADILGGAHPQLSENNQESLHQSTKEAALRKIHHQEGRGETYLPSVQNGPDLGRPISDGSDYHSKRGSKSDCPPMPVLENGRPVIESINSTVIALVGSQISLIARFCCNPRPRKVYWIHRHLAMMPSRIIGRYITRELIMSSNSMNCFTSSFIIDSVKPEDAGDVMFMVLNQKGIDQALISVNITHSSSYSVAASSGRARTQPSTLLSLISTILLILFLSNHLHFNLRHVT